MRKKYVILLLVIVIFLSVSPIAFAVDFGPNSAKITNQYYPATVGAWSYMLGVKVSAGTVNYSNVVGIEEVSGAKIAAQTFHNVKCLKLNILNEDGFYSMWIAQDTLGNLWVLKGYSYFDDVTFLLGTDFTSMFMPVEPKKDDPAGLIVPENGSNYCRVVEANISVDTSYGNYNSCIKAHCYWASSLEDVEYYCPDAGIVRSIDGSNPQAIMDLKEDSVATVTKLVVIPLGD